MDLVVVGSRQYQAGTRDTPISPTLNPTWRTAILSLSREGWSDGARITMTIEVSLDGGSSWEFLAAAESSGGDVLDVNGNLVTHTRIVIPLPDVGNVARRLRASVTNTATLRTAIAVSAE